MDIGYILIVLLAIFFSMTLHELMHGLIANRLGDDTARLLGRLTFNPIKHIDPFLTLLLPLFIVVTNIVTGANAPIFGGAKPVPFNPNRIKYDEWGVALMAIAGPLTNLVIAFICYGAYIFSGADATSIAGQILITFVQVNIGFFAFNMLPIPPLDGSRVIYAFAPDFIRRFMESIEQYGLFVILLIVMVSGPLLQTYIIGVARMILTGFQLVFGA
jgi:Zn-dependent protease